MSDINEEKLAEELEITALEFEADDNGIITAFSDIGLAGGSDGAPSAGGSKDILATPGYGNTLNQISQLDFKFVKASAPSDLAEPQDGEIKVSLYPYGERKSGDAYDSPVLVIGGTWNGVRYAPHVDYISGSSSQVAPIWIHPRSGKIEATVFSAPAGGFNNLTLTANVDGFLISGGTTNSRSLTITSGNLTLTSGSNNPNVTIPNTATATAVVNTSSFTQYGVVFSSSATNGIVSSTGQGASGQPLVGAGASNPVFGSIDIANYVTGILGVGNGGTGTSTTFTTGSVVFAGASGVYTQDNSNLYWDNTNDTLGVGTTRAGAISGTNPRLRVKGSGATSSTSSFEVQDSAAGSLFLIRDDGLINFGSSGSFTNSTGQLALSTSGSGAGILLGGDANLYRSAADTLKTDDSLVVGANLSVLNAGTFSLYESGSVNFSSFVAGTQANDLRYTLPTSQPSTNQVLTATSVTGTGPYDIALGWVSNSTDMAIGGTVTSGTTGSVLFVGSGPVLAQDNANLFFDDTNDTLGVGTTRSGAISGTNPRLRVKGSGATSSTSGFEVQNSSASSLFLVRDDGLINFGSSGSFTNSTGQFALSTTGSGAGILLGGDALLYRSAADVLRTPDSLTVDTNLSIGGGTTFGTSTFVSNSARAYYDATNGFVLTGKTGSSYDFAMAAPSGSLLWTNPTGTSNLSIVNGGLTTGTYLDAGSYVDINGGSYASSKFRLYYDSTNGAQIASRTGSTNDFAIYRPNGTQALVIPTGTGTISAPNGKISVGSTLYTTSGAIDFVGSTSGTVSVLVQATAGTYNFNLPTTAGSSGYVLTSAGGGATAMTWTDPATLAVRWNSIANPTGNQSLSMSTNTTTWNWATGTSTNNLFSLTTDASANGTGALLNIATGASSTVVPLLVKAGGTTALTVNASAQVLVNSLTSGRVTYAGTNGLLQDSANMTFDGNRLALATTGNTGGLLIGGDANLYRSAADVLKTDDSLVVATNLTVSTMTSGSILFAGTSGLVSQDNTNFFWDDANNYHGIGTASPTARLHLAGAQSASAWTTAGIALRVASATYTDTSSSGTVTNQHASVFEIPTFAASSSTTYTHAATLQIRGNVAAGSNVSITNAYALYVLAGNSRFDDTVAIGTANTVSRLSIGGAYSAAAWGSQGITIRVAGQTITDTTSSGTVAAAHFNTIGTPTLAASSVTTYTSAASLYINAAPAAGSNVTITTGYALWVNSGPARIDDSLYIGGLPASTGKLILVGNFSTTAWGTNAPLFRIVAGTLTDTSSSGTVANNMASSIAQPTLAASSSTTYTNAATLYIANAPAAGSNVSITNAYALYIAAGTVRFDGTLNLNAMTSGSVLFAGTSGAITQDNSNLYFDDTNNTLGVGTTRTGAISGTNPRLRVKGSGTTSSTSSFEVQDSAAGSLFLVRDDGLINLGSAGTYTNSTGQFALSTTGSGAGILIGGDTQLYRTSADVLRTPDSLQVDSYIGVNATPNTLYRVQAALTTSSNVSGRTFFGTNDITGNITSAFPAAAYFQTTPNAGASGISYVSGIVGSIRSNSAQAGTITEQYGIDFDNWHSGSANIGTMAGARSFVSLRNTSSGTVTAMTGFQATLDAQSGGTNSSVTAAYGFDFSASLAGASTISALTGYRVQNPSGSQTITTFYGIRINDLTRGGTNYGIYFDGTSGLSRQGVWWNGDTNLYRSAADTLKTDDSLVVGANLSVLNAGTFSLYESGSVNFSSFAAGTQANDLRYTLPTSQPSTNQVLTATAVSGTGPYDVTLGWAAPTSSISIGSTVTSGTAGSVLFVGSGPVLAQDNSNLYFDDTNDTLGVGTTRSGAISATNPRLRVKGSGATSSTSSFEVQDSGGGTSLFVRDDGWVGIGINAPIAKLNIAGNVSAASWFSTGGIAFRITSATYTDTSSSGTVASNWVSSVRSPTLAASSSTTFTDAATFHIQNVPTAGSNVSLTRAWTLYTEAGQSYLGDGITIGDVTGTAARISIGGNYSASAWGTLGVVFHTHAMTLTDTSSSGTVATVTANSFSTPTLAASSVTTYTDAANVYIANAPAAGSNVTLTNSYALWVDSGATRLDGNLIVGSLTSTRIPYASTGGLLVDSANMTFNGTRLALATTGNTGGLLIGGDTNLYRSSADVLATDDNFIAQSVFTYAYVQSEGYLSTGAGGGGTLGEIRILGDTSGTISIFPQTDAGTYNFNLPTTAGSSGYVLTSGGGGASPMTWTAPGALAVRWNSLTNPTGNLSLTMSTNLTTFNWATGTSTNNLFSLTTDASANGTGALLNIATGASATVLPLLVKAGATTGLTVNASAQVLIGSLTSGRVVFSGTSGLLQDSSNFTWDNSNNILDLGNTVQNRKLVFYTVAANDHQYYGLGINSGAFRLQLPDGSAAWKYYVGTSSSTSSQVFNIAGSGVISGGSNYGTAADRVTLDLSGSGSFAAADFGFAQGGLFRACETSVSGTNDIFFQAVPATTSGYGYLEAFNSAGLIVGTGNNTNPVIFQVNRTEVGRFNSTQLLTVVDVVAKGKKYWGGTEYNTGSGYRVSMDLAAFNFGAGFAGVAFDFPSGGRFAPIETSIAGTNDIFFQAIPATTSGYGYLEAFNSAGLIIGTGNNTNPVIVKINRSERVRFANTALQMSPHGSSSGNTYELQFLELAANGTDYLSFKAPDSIGTTITHTLPSNTPTAGDALKISSYSAGVAVLTWGTVAGSISIGTSISGGTTGSVLFVGAGPVIAQDNANFFWDDTNNFLGLGTASPAAKLHIAGNMTANAWGTNGIGLRIATTRYTDGTSSGTVASAVIYAIAAPQLDSSSAATFTNAANVYIAGPVSQTGSATITNPYSLWIGEGASKYDATSTLTSGTFTHEVSALTFTGAAGSAAMVGKSYVMTLTPGGAQTGSATGVYTEVANGASQSWSTGALAGHKVLMNMSGGGPTTVASVYGGQFIYQKTGANTLTNAYGLLVQQSGTHAGTTSNYHGLRIERNYSAGTITTAYGIYLQQVGNLGGGTTNGASVFMESDGTAKTGLVWGTSSPGDTNLYRSAADTLKTDDSLIVATNFTVSTMTSGSVLFAGTSGLLTQDNTNLYFDDTNNTLGVGTTRTGAISGTNPRLRVKGSGTTSSTSGFEVQNSSGSALFFVRDDGLVTTTGIQVVTKAHTSGVVTLTDGATPALDASLGNTFLLTAAGDRTIAVPSNPTSGQKITIVHKASGANRTLALNTGTGGFRFGTDITALTATTSALTDYIGAIYNSADNKWDVVSYVKGF